MDIKELATQLGVSKSTINLWIKRGKLKPQKIYIDSSHTSKYDFDADAVSAAKKLRSEMRNKKGFMAD